MRIAPHRPSAGKLSITHHTLSPHPHAIICTSFISSTDCTVFNLLQSHLNDRSGRKVTLSINIQQLYYPWDEWNYPQSLLCGLERVNEKNIQEKESND